MCFSRTAHAWEGTWREPGRVMHQFMEARPLWVGGRQDAMQRDLGIEFSIGKDIRSYGDGGGEREKGERGRGEAETTSSEA